MRGAWVGRQRVCLGASLPYIQFQSRFRLNETNFGSRTPQLFRVWSINYVAQTGTGRELVVREWRGRPSLGGTPSPRRTRIQAVTAPKPLRGCTDLLFMIWRRAVFGLMQVEGVSPGSVSCWVSPATVEYAPKMKKPANWRWQMTLLQPACCVYTTFEMRRAHV